MNNQSVSAFADGRVICEQRLACDHGHIALVDQGYTVSDRRTSRNGRAAPFGSLSRLPIETRGPSWRTNRRADPRGSDSCVNGVRECI